MVYRYEPDLELLLRRGEPFDGPAEFIAGEERNCHSNAAQLWNSNRATLTIATGYALSDNGLWRQHSWVMRKQAEAEQCRILETTVKRTRYFGFILNDSEAESFFENNG